MKPAILPSLFAFQPRHYRGGAIRFYLPLLYDLVATVAPRRIVVLGFGNGDAFFTLCQAVRENGLNCECIAFWRGKEETDRAADEAWQEGLRHVVETYPDFARLESVDAANASAALTDRKVDLLLIDDCDLGREISAELQCCDAILSPAGSVLLHGLELQRDDAPKSAWRKWVGERPGVDLAMGAGLGMAWPATHPAADSFLFHCLTSVGVSDGIGLLHLYALVVERIEAQSHSAQAMAELSALSARQIWLESLLDDRKRAQETMDDLAGQLAELHRDRAKAQLVMDSQHEQLRQWLAEGETRKRDLEKLKAQLKEQKRIIQAAKKACRKGGRCFVDGGETKRRKPLVQRLAREIGRIPRNLGLRPKQASPQTPVRKSGKAKAAPEDRYIVWQREHEPDETGLARQRQEAGQWKDPPLISLLLPVVDPPAKFLDDLLASIAAQTAPNWEVCLVDGGSRSAATRKAIADWSAREPRIHHQRLSENLGVAENTNRALTMASGEVIACVDHDDLLSPFAIYELTNSILSAPEADIFYSDEDRCDENGKRHTPFFKPEWSPELLWSSMYLGHITAYRRALADALGGFRKQFDLSQDYDFALRATERTREVRHIPRVLYHWREHPASGSAGGKPEARLTNLAALKDAMQRRNLPAEIVEYPTANRARLQPATWPRVSIVIPTDSPGRAQRCLEHLPNETDYPELEIVIVTNSALLSQLQAAMPERKSVQLIPYDEPFNFSDKCNAGARAASGERLIFLNDDVETLQSDWIQNLIEPLENTQVGAVAPKLLYESGKIQHAGLVVGVRGLVGTAFHQRAADSCEHFNFAQSLRNVSALSAACLAVRREDFFQAGGFDAINTPVSHSDVDLCFKIREAGLRCVYTPFATLRHTGHVSIAAEEKTPARDKASIYLLKRWPEFTTHDPYFPDNMRDWLYTDSPAPIRMRAQSRPAGVATRPDLLLVSHDLSLSGAPIMLWHAARCCREQGIFAVVISPNDGPLREKFYELGLPVIIDPLVADGHESFVQFARDFDCVIANSIRSKAVARALHGAGVPVVWWVHEPGSVGEHYLRADADLRATLPLADLVVAPAERTAEIYRTYRTSPVKALHNAIPDLGLAPAPKIGSRRLRFLLLASIEPRKGQDLFLEAAASLPPDLQEAAEFQIAGRILDPEFWLKVDGIAAAVKHLAILGPLSHQDAIEQMREADVIVSASRDEALPVIILEALSLGRALIATTVGGVADVLTNGRDALLVRPESPAALAAAMRRVLENPAIIAELAQAARASYERQFTLARFGRDFRRLIDDAISLSTGRQEKTHELG